MESAQDICGMTKGPRRHKKKRGGMLHGSETWPERKESVVALQQTVMRMVRWMCGVKLKDRLPSKELRD